MQRQPPVRFVFIFIFSKLQQGADCREAGGVERIHHIGLTWRRQDRVRPPLTLYLSEY